MRGIFTILLLSLSNIIIGQDATISGVVSFHSLEPESISFQVALIDTSANIIQTTQTNPNGNYQFSQLMPGTYEVHITKDNVIEQIVSEIAVNQSDQLKLDIILNDPCDDSHKPERCPYCTRSSKILKTSPGTIVSYNFGNNKKAADRFDKKIQKKGYETYVNEQGEEIVIAMYIKGQRKKFLDRCHRWFCKRCKKIF